MKSEAVPLTTAQSLVPSAKLPFVIRFVGGGGVLDSLSALAESGFADTTASAGPASFGDGKEWQPHATLPKQPNGERWHDSGFGVVALSVVPSPGFGAPSPGRSAPSAAPVTLDASASASPASCARVSASAPFPTKSSGVISSQPALARMSSPATRARLDGRIKTSTRLRPRHPARRRHP